MNGETGQKDSRETTERNEQRFLIILQPASPSSLLTPDTDTVLNRYR